MDNDHELRWTADLGALLQRARGPMSKREAARRAGFSESTWRALELGVRRPAKGIAVPVNPTVGTLVAAADALGLDRVEVLGAAGVDGFDHDGHHDGSAGDDPAVERRLSAIEGRLDVVEASQQEILDELRGGRG